MKSYASTETSLAYFPTIRAFGVGSQPILPEPLLASSISHSKHVVSITNYDFDVDINP